MSKPFLIDVSPVYDLLLAMGLVARPSQVKGRWEIWARETASTLELEQARRLSHWFGDVSAPGAVCVAIAPIVPGAHDIPAFLTELERLPVPDFLRLMVSSSELAVTPPMQAHDLLALIGDRRAVREYIDRYLGLTGRQRSHLIQILIDPESARRDLLGILRFFAASYFDELEPSLREERVAAGEHLTKAAYRLPDALPEWLSWIGEHESATLAPLVLLGNQTATYYHELDRSLFDGMDFEPLISMVGTERVLTEPGYARRSGRLRPPALTSPDPVERWAQLHAALADPTRLRILRLLMESPRYGQELAALMSVSGATISHHISELSRAGILRLERRGQRTYFQIQSEALRALLDESRRYLFETASDPTPENPKDEVTS
ncbi:MAG TPA: metalloregulator ArsR/SmtB family transcription factor [Ktedonobacterales bacterium]|jgi:DNA-binding transcriptional ArsR family regulator